MHVGVCIYPPSPLQSQTRALLERAPKENLSPRLRDLLLPWGRIPAGIATGTAETAATDLIPDSAAAAPAGMSRPYFAFLVEKLSTRDDGVHLIAKLRITV